MTHILIQIWRWLMQPKVWRFIGFASAVVGLVCYALSSSFNYLFGDWNFLKLFLYIIFSFIICFVILFAKLLQHSRSLRFKAHTAFLVLTITSVYSFFFDKVMNGKPDAYSLISCAAFAIMSLSLSRQTQCGFEIDLLYFFLGCLIVQLMKIKLQLFILGAGFSYSLIILRSFFSSIDARGDDQYSQLQDENSVVLYMNSLQLANIDIASDSNRIDSSQLMIANDISSVMEQLMAFVKALQHESVIIIQMIFVHVEKYYAKKQSQFVFNDPNFMMDAFKLETIKGLEKTAKVMVCSGFGKDFSIVYNSCRRECLDKCLNRLFSLEKYNIQDVHNIPWKELEDNIESWIRASNVALKMLFPGERQLCNRIFFGFSSVADFSFLDICKGWTIQLVTFVNAIATRSHSPERLFKILEVFQTLCDLIPEFESLFCDQYSVSLINEAMTIWKRLKESIKGIFMELQYLIGKDPVNVTVNGGGLHPITQYVMNYLSVVCQSRQTLEQVFEDSSFSQTIHRIMDILESNLEMKSKCYDDPSIGYIFLMNNNTYIVQVTKDNELGTILGYDWLQKHALKVWHYYGREVQQSPYKTRHYDGREVLQSLYNARQIGKIDRSNVEGSEGSKGYERDVQLIEASLTQLERIGTKDSEAEIRTIVISPSQQFGMAHKMSPDDGFTWKKYKEKEMLDFKYPRSYYMCNHMTRYSGGFKKKVQQLDDNPNMFEVTYKGGHSCCMSLTKASLILPPRKIRNTSNSKDIITQTTMPPSSTSYSRWLSSATPVKSISSIPEVNLPAPANGGHHPMMYNVADYLVSAIRSQKIKFVNADRAFSTQTEEPMKLLESILEWKSKIYADTSLRHFFMMNNWRYLEVAIQRRELNEIFGNIWCQKFRVKVQQKLELYQRNSWEKVLDFLKLDINDSSVEINLAVDSMKENLSCFNMHLAETLRIQCTWSVHDEKLRGEIISSLKNILLPVYGTFIGKFQNFLKNDAYEYIEYGIFDIEDVLDSLFLGNKTDE
ncbi:uncharacterized protein LOC123923489 [Trifolium pratense]|uniref:uncharacterized protein LOC123923489 n=1 Tax=Trifolium pratense TaxID=57577 RepID=UPI001E697CCE|nr:uncharacterized protein LOC123923489 [Trifolium pratense]